MQPGGPAAPPPGPAANARGKRMLLALAVSALVVAAGVSIYLLARPPPVPLAISDGSTAALSRATFSDYSDTAYGVAREYTATTTANQSGGPTSILTLDLQTNSAWVPISAVLAEVDTAVFVTVRGAFASNLRPTGLTLACNSTGGGTPGGWAEPGGTNVSYDPTHPQTVPDCNGAVGFTPTLENVSDEGPVYAFVFVASVGSLWGLDGGDQFLGFRATVTGPFAPAVSVGILLHLVDIPAPPFTMCFYANIRKSADGSAWDLNVTTVDQGVSNGTMYLAVVGLDGATVLPTTAFGSLWTSPVHASIAYLPVVPGSGNVRPGDLLTFSAALYSRDYLVEVSNGGGLLYAATLG